MNERTGANDHRKAALRGDAGEQQFRIQFADLIFNWDDEGRRAIFHIFSKTRLDPLYFPVQGLKPARAGWMEQSIPHHFPGAG
jgi:hypothetical protein